MNEFIEYVLSFYGHGEMYDMGVSRDDVLLATGMRLALRKDIDFDGDTLDREMVRDILIENFGYIWKVAA
jgi:hypothetical protein